MNIPSPIPFWLRLLILLVKNAFPIYSSWYWFIPIPLSITLNFKQLSYFGYFINNLMIPYLLVYFENLKEFITKFNNIY